MNATEKGRGGASARVTATLTTEQRESLPFSPPVSPEASQAAAAMAAAVAEVAVAGGVGAEAVSAAAMTVAAAAAPTVTNSGVTVLPTTTALCRRSPRVPTKPQRDGYVDITQPGLSFAMPKGGIKKGETYADQLPMILLGHENRTTVEVPSKSVSARSEVSPVPSGPQFDKRSKTKPPATDSRSAAAVFKALTCLPESQKHVREGNALTSWSQVELTNNSQAALRTEADGRGCAHLEAAQVAAVRTNISKVCRSRKRRPTADAQDVGDDDPVHNEVPRRAAGETELAFLAEEDEEDIPVSQLRLRHLLLRSPKKMKRIEPKTAVGVGLDTTADPHAPDSEDEVPIFHFRTKSKSDSAGSTIPALTVTSVATVSSESASRQIDADQPACRIPIETKTQTVNNKVGNATLSDFTTCPSDQGHGNNATIGRKDPHRQPDGCPVVRAKSVVTESFGFARGKTPLPNAISPSSRPVRTSRSPVNYNEAELLAVRRPVYLDWAGKAGQDPSESGTKYAVRKGQSPTLRGRLSPTVDAVAISVTRATATASPTRCAGVYGKRRTAKGRVEYLVRWGDCDHDQNESSWEGADRLVGAAADIEQFERRLQTAQALANADVDTSDNSVTAAADDADDDDGGDENPAGTAATPSGLAIDEVTDRCDKAHRRSSLGSPTDSDDDLPMRRLRQKLHDTNTSSVALAATAATADTLADGNLDEDEMEIEMEVLKETEEFPAGVSTTAEGDASIRADHCGQDPSGTTIDTTGAPTNVQVQLPDNDRDVDSRSTACRLAVKRTPELEVHLQPQASKPLPSLQLPPQQKASAVIGPGSGSLALATTSSTTAAAAAAATTTTTTTTTEEAATAAANAAQIAASTTATTAAATTSDPIEREAQMATAIMQQVIASQQADKAERQRRNIGGAAAVASANGIHLVGPPSSGRRVMPGAVRRMVNRMIKPRSAFFSQPKETHRDCSGPQRPPPAAAAWPSVVSGAPAGAGRESPARTYNSARGFMEGSSGVSTTAAVSTTASSGGQSNCVLSGTNATGESCELVAGSQPPRSPYRCDIYRVDSRPDSREDSRQYGSVVVAAEKRSGSSTKKVVHWCVQIARVREYSESEREMEERRDWQRGIIARRDDMRSAFELSASKQSQPITTSK